jgi:hypothetical protein
MKKYNKATKSHPPSSVCSGIGTSKLRKIGFKVNESLGVL